ncbi:MAG: DMT family transporter [Eggerthellaceae bacterium]|nr:DMT family transporter [Eggerthellaceae bacterium]
MRAHVVALLTVFVWGITFVSTKVLLQGLSPGWILLIRFALGLVALCILRPRVLHVASRRDEALFALAGLTGIAAYYLLENVALVYASATAVGIIVTVSPLFTAIIAALRGQRGVLTPRFAAGFAVAMSGIVLVSLGGSAGTPDGAGAGAGAAPAGGDAFLLGCALSLGAAGVWAVYSTVVARIAAAGYETIAATKRTFAWGLVLMAPVVLAGYPAPAPAVLIDPVFAANLLFLGLVASAACFATWGYAVSRLGAVTTSTYIYLVPVVTATASAAVLGEALTPAVVAGMTLTLGGLVLSQGPKA